MAADHSPLLVLLETPLHLETTTFHFSHLLTTDTHVSLRTGSTHTEKCRETKQSFGLNFLSYRRFFCDVTSHYKSFIEHPFLNCFANTKQNKTALLPSNKENCKGLTKKKENLTLSFIRRSFTMKFATTDFIGEANWSGANIEM